MATQSYRERMKANEPKPGPSAKQRKPNGIAEPSCGTKSESWRWTRLRPGSERFIPVASPICLRRLRAKETPELGIIMPEQDCYPDYRKNLDSVTAEEFAVLALSQNPAERRRGIAVVNS